MIGRGSPISHNSRPRPKPIMSSYGSSIEGTASDGSRLSEDPCVRIGLSLQHGGEPFMGTSNPNPHESH